MNRTAAKWTRYGRWSEDGLQCFALLDHLRAREGDAPVVIYEAKEVCDGQAKAETPLRRR